MHWTHLKPADGRRTPWKNGGGTTLEWAIEPPGATLQSGFRWRVSSAEVGVSGPFSAFPGLERWLLLLEGKGFAIDFGFRGQVELTEPLVPIRFSGDWPATATLVEGPCMDFNLMADLRTCQAELEVLSLAAPRQRFLSAATSLVFVARGTVYVSECEVHLGQRHTLRVDGGAGPLQLVPGYGGASLVIIGINQSR